MRHAGRSGENPSCVTFDHHDPRFVEDPAERVRPILEEPPLLHSDLYGGFWLLTRYEDVTQAALDYESFTSAVPGMTIIPPSQPRTYPLIPIELDPPAHTRYRGLVNALFSRTRIDALGPELEALATRLLEPIARTGGGDVIAEFAYPMSLGALARFMNLPEEDEEQWFDWVERMFANALIDPADQRRPSATSRPTSTGSSPSGRRSRATTSSGCSSRRRSTASG